MFIYYIYIKSILFFLCFFSLFCFYRKENLLLYKEIVHSVCIVIKGRILRSKSFGTPAFHVYIYVKDIKSIESLFRAGYIYDNCVSSSKLTSVMLSDRAFPEFINPMKPRRNVARRSIGSHVYRLSSLKGMKAIFRVPRDNTTHLSHYRRSSVRFFFYPEESNFHPVELLYVTACEMECKSMWKRLCVCVSFLMCAFSYARMFSKCTCNSQVFFFFFLWRREGEREKGRRQKKRNSVEQVSIDVFFLFFTETLASIPSLLSLPILHGDTGLFW